jgi:primosomal protein N' (replication factor Y)
MFDVDQPFELRLTNLAKIRAEVSSCKLIYCGYPHSLENVMLGGKPDSYPAKTDVINMVYEIGSVDQPLVSEGLVKAVNEEIESGRPTIILLNRKGFSNFVYCDECGQVLKCPKCQVPLTYHASTGSVSCRFCGFKELAPDTCPSCQSIFIRFKAGGTERLRIELSRRLIAGRLLDAEGGQMDSAKNLRQFGKPGDVLVSTTMMLDRADLSNVKLISIASIDGLLSMPVFSATHKAYALIGILGSRLPKDGRLLIQTYMSHHPLFAHIKEKTLDELLSIELDDRLEAMYPPYTQMLIWHVVGRDEKITSSNARYAASKLSQLLGQESVIGPNAGYFHRLKGEYRWDILLKIKDISSLLEPLRRLHAQLVSEGSRIEVTNPNT